MKISRVKSLLTAIILVASTGSAESQTPALAPAPTYADLADLALPAQVVAHVRVASAARLKPAEAPGLAAGRTRFYVQADVISLIRGPGEMAARVSYLVDLPNDADGKAPKLRKKEERLIFAASVPGRPGELRLLAPDAQIAAVPADAERLRAILREAAGARAAPRITGIGKAFHVPGSLPGESETQIFLLTAENRPVSLSIVRRPGQAPRWAVALSEIVDESAAAPARNSLLWYRLACGLPRTLPPQSLADADRNDAGAIRADYGLVLNQLGGCPRNRIRR
ncbi:MAG TPA: hypothetical protein VF631_04165 [Allosphingosinicella sp.]|jgi:hypothetical protein|uniref:hypothetical protein n=1 Tax=Allosphingosinicella sp. TaxID=2823234 RepID=UPI002F2A6A96